MDKLAQFLHIIPDQEMVLVFPKLGIRSVYRLERLADDLNEATKDFCAMQSEYMDKLKELRDVYQKEIPEGGTVTPEQLKKFNDGVKALGKEFGIEEKSNVEVSLELGDDKFEMLTTVVEQSACKDLFVLQADPSKKATFFQKKDLVKLASALGLE